MEEINKIVIDSIELRIIKGDQSQWCETFQSGKWSRVSATELHQLSFDKRVCDWLNRHYYTTNNIQKFPDDNNKNESSGLSNSAENKTPQVLTPAALLRNFLLNQVKSRKS